MFDIYEQTTIGNEQAFAVAGLSTQLPGHALSEFLCIPLFDAQREPCGCGASIRKKCFECIAVYLKSPRGRCEKKDREKMIQNIVVYL